MLFEWSGWMSNVTIVSAYDGQKTAQGLMRLLTAEQHVVETIYGRQSLDRLQEVAAGDQAVLLIWSMDAPSAHYMLEWLRNIAPKRLIEVARTPGWPQTKARVGSVIDFSSWGGERGGRAWRALTERLDTVARVMRPEQPAPLKPILVMGALSAALLVGAGYQRAHAPSIDPAAKTDDTQVAAAAPIGDGGEGRGGPLQVTEPASADDEFDATRPISRVRNLDTPLARPLTDTDIAPPQYFRAPTMVERVTWFAQDLRDDLRKRR
jgi:hypothetical protein